MTDDASRPDGSVSSEGLGPTLDAWAEAHGVRFANRSYGQYTTDSVSREALETLLANVLMAGIERGRKQAADASAERVRSTELVAGETPSAMREAIAQRVADLGKPTAWAGA